MALHELRFSADDDQSHGRPVAIRPQGRPRPYGAGAIVSLGYLAICDKSGCGFTQQEKTGIEAQSALIVHQREKHA